MLKQGFLKRSGCLALACTLAFQLMPVYAAQAEEQTWRYEPAWESVEQVDTAPEWFQDAKFGIYFHWGAFTTPEYGDEWYGQKMNGSFYNHHEATYGTPWEWPYHNFIVGAEEKAAEAEKAAKQAEEEREAAQKAREEAEARQLEAEQIKKQIEKEQAALQEALRKSQAAWAEAEKTAKQTREELEKLKRDLEKAEAQVDKQEEKTKITRPGRVRLKSVKCLKKGQLTVTWKKVKEADGYRIQYSQNPEFKRAVTKKAGKGKTNIRLKNLEAGKTCYIRIRAVKKTERGNVYGAYSKVKKVKVR